jgi:hypothetical protein
MLSFVQDATRIDVARVPREAVENGTGISVHTVDTFPVCASPRLYGSMSHARRAKAAQPWPAQTSTAGHGAGGARALHVETSIATDKTPTINRLTKRPRGVDVVSALDGDARGPPPKQAREDENEDDAGAAAGPVPPPAATGVAVPPTWTSTADDINAAIARAEKGLETALAKEDEYKAIADDQNRTPEERAQANRRLDVIIDDVSVLRKTIAFNTERLLLLGEADKTMAAAVQRPALSMALAVPTINAPGALSSKYL